MRKPKGTIRLSLQNATELLAEAELLFRHGRFSRSIALSTLAMEELGKVGIIRTLATQPDRHLGQAWKDFRRHVAKTAPAAMFFLLNDLTKSAPRMASAEFVRRGAEAVQPGNSPERDHLEVVKQACFYVDFDDRDGWSSPQTLASRERAESYLATAKTHMNHTVGGAWNTEAQLSILARHLLAVDHESDPGAFLPAFIAAAKEAESAGVMSGPVTSAFLETLPH